MSLWLPTGILANHIRCICAALSVKERISPFRLTVNCEKTILLHLKGRIQVRLRKLNHRWGPFPRKLCVESAF